MCPQGQENAVRRRNGEYRPLDACFRNAEDAVVLTLNFSRQSTSPSHSVNANVQGVLHLLKSRQPRLCERMQSLPGSEPKRRSGSHRAPQSPSDGAAALGSLSELLLALQDELGHMSLWVIHIYKTLCVCL